MSDTRKLAESVRRWREQSGECGWTDDRVAACVAAHLQPVSPSDIEDRYRRLLWLSHGHGDLLYGDDGEMQCNGKHLADFKREPLDKLEAHVLVARAEAISKPAPTEGPSAFVSIGGGYKCECGGMIVITDGHWRCALDEMARPSELSAELDTRHCDMCKSPVTGSVHYELVSGVHRCIQCANRLREAQGASGVATSSTSAAAKENHEKV